MQLLNNKKQYTTGLIKYESMDHSLNSPGDAITLVTHFEDRHKLPIFLTQNQAADSELASSPIVIDKKGYCISV
jgi:hypothetical protein